jgi:hypothetical protein
VPRCTAEANPASPLHPLVQLLQRGRAFRRALRHLLDTSGGCFLDMKAASPGPTTRALNRCVQAKKPSGSSVIDCR